MPTSRYSVRYEGLQVQSGQSEHKNDSELYVYFGLDKGGDCRSIRSRSELCLVSGAVCKRRKLDSNAKV